MGNNYFIGNGAENARAGLRSSCEQRYTCGDSRPRLSIERSSSLFATSGFGAAA